MYKKDILKSRILYLINKIHCKIYARKCIIKNVSQKDTETFLNKNHIQSNYVSDHRIGLYFNNELVSIMCFNLIEENLYELTRF